MSLNTSVSNTSTFNPHEILAKLRSKGSNSSNPTESVPVNGVKQGIQNAPADTNSISSKNTPFIAKRQQNLQAQSPQVPNQVIRLKKYEINFIPCFENRII